MMQAFGGEGSIAIKTDAAIDYIGEKLGVPAAIRNDAAERAVILEEQQAQQAQMLAAQATAQAATADQQNVDSRLMEALNAG